jgi:RNA polymerase sigma factor (sigma-70 family)
VAFKKSANSAGPRVWSVAELGAFYTENRAELLAHANRVLKDSAKAEEITQDALIKFMLAAPELETKEHAIGYLHRTIENLCIDYFRAEGRRPNLVVIDDAQAEVEATWLDNGDHAEAISAAEDAAIIRQALALLSPAERAALVMWEMEGRSTAEIAAELGIKESSVRHTVSRARASLRRVLSELVIDEKRGLTALDMLSTSYKKAAKLAEKTSKAALSLVLVLTAFLGFNSLTGNEGSTLLPTLPVVSNNAKPTSTATSSTFAASTATAEATAAATAAAKKIESMMWGSAAAVKGGAFRFFGLDKEGVPTGFTVTDGSGAKGKLRVTGANPANTEFGAVLSNQAITLSDGPNVLLGQTLTVTAEATTYEVSASVGIKGAWVPLEVSDTTYVIERMSNGNYLVTATILVSSSIDIDMVIPVGTRGSDLAAAPKSIVTRLVLDAGKTKVLAQAVSVNDSVNSAKGGAK